MYEAFIVFSDLMIILLLIAECWMIYESARDHSITLDLINHNLIEMKKLLRNRQVNHNYTTDDSH